MQNIQNIGLQRLSGLLSLGKFSPKENENLQNMQNIGLQMIMHKNVAHRYAIFLCSLDVEIYADDSLVGKLTNKNLIQLIINLSSYDYELKIIAEMAKTNSIVLPFAS